MLMNERTKIVTKSPIAKTQKSTSRRQKPDIFQSTNSPGDNILFLQKTAGNQAIQRMLKSGALQAKLKIGQPNDKYEQEADRVANQVMRMPEPRVQKKSAYPFKDSSFNDKDREEDMIQTKPIADQITPMAQRQPEEEEKEILQTKPLATLITPLLQCQSEPEEEIEEDDEDIQAKGKSGPTPVVTPQISSNIDTLRGGGQPLPDSARAFLAPRFGMDFSEVRVHTDGQSAQIARSMNAQALTVGRDVVFGAGQYALGTSEGLRLLAHELTHVVQQKSLNRNNAVKTFALTPNAYPDSRKPGTFNSTISSISKPIIQTKCPDTAVLSSSYPIKFHKSYFPKFRTWLRLMSYIKVGPKASYKSCIYEQLKVVKDTCGTKGGFGLLRNGGMWKGKPKKGRKACAGTKRCFPVGEKGARGHTGPNIFIDRHTTNLPFSLLKGSGMKQCTIKCLQHYTCGGKKLTGKFYVTRNFKASTINKEHVTAGTITKVKA
jgi:hypothetical protein